MQRRGIVAEPTTLILLGAGGLLMFGFPVSVAYLKNRSQKIEVRSQKPEARS